MTEPLILGHEVSGTVEAIGPGVALVAPGDPVALNPSRPCGSCRYCLQGMANHCMDMRFYGSAMRNPHIQGAFCDALIADETQCIRVPAALPLTHAAFAEPFSVGLHAVRRAGEMVGKRVLVTGQGPIGTLAVAAARVAGAVEIVVTDIVDAPLALSTAMGADRAINVATDPEALSEYAADKGYFDVVLEASANERALHGAIEVTRPRGVIVQIGVGGAMSVPLNVIVAKELDLRGTFRFHEEFELAAGLIGSGRVDVSPLLTEVIPLAEATRAFELASDRSAAMKVQLAFA